ncbi:FAD/NAD(P)-binding domain-containing protein [Trichodelitschia bisporula]|uniref:FAD/NAD(P)-binding domain-containing protein n=1 Tax=Trichodelitschia bisporula TaxID=703511 RepID=A0A6G1IAH8_9PEZI|nr:FAD/NAD(P)-binding domain-containing protein [Trichodelitschia bisporula]
MVKPTKPTRTPAFPISKLPGALPTTSVPDGIDPLPVAEDCLSRLQDLDDTLISSQTIWRDLYALTGTVRTLHGAANVVPAWRKLWSDHQPVNHRITPGSVKIVRPPGPPTSWVEAKITFQTSGVPPLLCSGILRIVHDSQTWKLWTMITMLQGIDGLGNVDECEPVVDWQVERPLTPFSDSNGSNVHDCVVVGAGMSGLCVAGYLKALGVSAVVLEKNAYIGQNWTDRYDSVRIHTSRAYGQLPFARMWGPEYPYHLGINDLKEGYQKFVKMYGLDVWLSTTLVKSTWDAKERTWTLKIAHLGLEMTIKTRHIVLAIGGGGQEPRMPTLQDRESFSGLVLHSAQYKSATEWSGLKGVVIGTANSGHDVANDMLRAGLSSVTMVQRGRTPVLPVEYYQRIYDPIYNDEVPVAVSDGIMMTTPTAIARQMAMRAISNFASQDSERFDSLERAGFRAERNMDLYHCLLERFGGHYLDVGVSRKISAGFIRMKSDAVLTGYTESGLRFDDGSTLDADVVVFATGFEGNMRLSASKFFDREVDEKLEDWWCVDCEGEMRGGWKPIGHPGVWFTGGNVAQARFFGRFLALQIKADLEGVPFKIYSERPALAQL